MSQQQRQNQRVVTRSEFILEHEHIMPERGKDGQEKVGLRLQ
jgi:hypothetical protein